MPAELRFDFILIYFVYGLAFFSMGLAVMMEASRSPLLAEARILWPLATFGFVHGVHEWLEIALELRQWFGFTNPDIAPLIRLCMLVVSFACLACYGFRVLRPSGRLLTFSNSAIVLGLIGIYTVLAIFTTILQISHAGHWMKHADALARYTLAVPGAGMAALALTRQASDALAGGRRPLALSLRGAAVGFAIYSLSQIFVARADFYPATVVNAQAFLAWMGFPIQAVRAAMAVLITICLIRATQVLEIERSRQLAAAQESRLEALEQLQRDLAERDAMRRELLRHTVVAQEDERARIARELHDETSQFLTVLNLDLATLKGLIRRNSEASMILDRVQVMRKKVAESIYRLVHDLRPAQLDDLGLVSALGYLVDEARSYGLEVTLNVLGSRRRLDPLVETVLFRIAQEALTNVARHAGCGQATIGLEYETSDVRLSIEDSGVGFNLHKIHQPPHGWGLEGMRERAESVGGDIEIQSTQGAGTHIRVVIPLEEGVYEYDPVNAG